MDAVIEAALTSLRAEREELLAAHEKGMVGFRYFRARLPAIEKEIKDLEDFGNAQES